MSPTDYLGKIVEKYSITRESDIAKTLQEARAKVEECIREEFGDVPTIRYGGSYAKCTMVSTSYDLDVLCYFPRDASDPGETLKAVFESVKTALETEYVVDPKRTALRISEKQCVNRYERQRRALLRRLKNRVGNRYLAPPTTTKRAVTKSCGRWFKLIQHG